MRETLYVLLLTVCGIWLGISGHISAVSSMTDAAREKHVAPSWTILTMETEVNDAMFVDPEYYTELHRPQYHFSTPVGRLADPNGLVFFDGEYHLFHQKMGRWAHAISRDLLHWEHQPIALDHDHLGQALSGSVVVDWNDSSGFFGGKPGLVAIYTSTEGGEAQSIAYSKDRGRTWDRYEGNPVIPNPGIKDFRDPKVFWHEETDKWIMVVSTDKSVTFYNSDNLIDWTYLSQFGYGHGSHVAVWECPDLFRLPVDGDPGQYKWVLHVSVGDNEVTNGSTAQYFIGEFDGDKFTNDHPPQTVLITDFGQDFYAAQTFSDVPDEDGRRIWMGWMSNWRYPYEAPTHPWKGSMSIPRQLSLRTHEDGIVRLVQRPIHEMAALRATHYTIEPFVLSDIHRVEGFVGTTFEFELEVEWDEAHEFGIVVRKSAEEGTIVGIDTVAGTVFVDRSDSGLSMIRDRSGSTFQFGRRYETTFSAEAKRVKLHGFVDESSVEVFVNDGEQVFTNLIFTRPTNRDIQLYSKGGSVHVISLNLYHLRSTWRPAAPLDEVERILLSKQHLALRVGLSETVEAVVKPDWFGFIDNLKWEIADPTVARIVMSKPGVAQVHGESRGSTRLWVTDPTTEKTTSIPIWVD